MSHRLADSVRRHRPGWFAFARTLLPRPVMVRPGKAARRISTVVVSAGLTLTVTLGVGLAYVEETAHVSATGAKGSATPTLTTITATGQTISGTLYPGGTADLKVSINNPYNVGITITGVTAGTSSITVSTPGVGICTTTGVTFATPSPITPSTLAANAASTQITLTGAVSMTSASDSGCQGATFTVPVELTVKVG